VEIFHRRLKDVQKARLAGPDWPRHLPWFLLGLHAAPREDSGLSAAELVFGAPLNLPAAMVTGDKPPEAIVEEMASFLPCVAPLQLPLPSPPPAALMKAAYVYVRSPPAAPSLSSYSRKSYFLETAIFSGKKSVFWE
jgi:hypothetical protein